MNDKDQLWKLKRYYEKVLIDYYLTDEIDPDMANRIVGGLTRFMNITEQQQQEIERLKKFLNWEQEEGKALDEEVTFQLEQLKQAQAKVEQYEKSIKECIERMNEGGSGTRSFVYEKLKEVMEGTGCMGK